MPRGGKRLGSGSKPKWKHGKTKTIRVPEALADEILEIARKLDNKEFLVSDTESNTIDLSGISIPQFKDKKFLFLQDLLQLGYEIEPLSLANVVRHELLNKQGKRNREDSAL